VSKLEALLKEMSALAEAEETERRIYGEKVRVAVCLTLFLIEDFFLRTFS